MHRCVHQDGVRPARMTLLGLPGASWWAGTSGKGRNGSAVLTAPSQQASDPETGEGCKRSAAAPWKQLPRSPPGNSSHVLPLSVRAPSLPTFASWECNKLSASLSSSLWKRDFFFP